MLSHCPHRQGEKDRGILGSFTKKTGCLAEVMLSRLRVGAAAPNVCLMQYSALGGPGSHLVQQELTATSRTPNSRVLPRALSIHQTGRELGVCGPTHQGWSGHSSEQRAQHSCLCLGAEARWHSQPAVSLLRQLCTAWLPRGGARNSLLFSL